MRRGVHTPGEPKGHGSREQSPWRPRTPVPRVETIAVLAASDAGLGSSVCYARNENPTDRRGVSTPGSGTTSRGPKETCQSGPSSAVGAVRSQRPSQSSPGIEDKGQAKLSERKKRRAAASAAQQSKAQARADGLQSGWTSSGGETS